ncbi:MAG: class I SAM-dependent RNA methyltransferase [Chloroflexi bacterium]|nr:class I SAM-dependent RNA methyltransferase [Chloroflexota bacterium]
MQPVTLSAICKFGLEKLVKSEIARLGFPDPVVSDGSVEFTAVLTDIPRLNLWLRYADRLLLKVGAFPALTFDELYEQSKALPWEDWLPVDGRFPVDAKSVKSGLQSLRSCQSIVKKAVVDRLQAAYHTADLPETGGEYAIQVALLNDVATLTLDTSGAGLHKRGYRTANVAAPLKETFAAGLVWLSPWRSDGLLLDPMCGSGTILIEAALQARQMAPGLGRSFAAEAWPILDAAWWQGAREAARAMRRAGPIGPLLGYDIDAAAVAASRQNAANAGVADDIVFTPKDVRDLWIDQQFGVLICNPPYGRRLSDFQEMNQLYIALNKMLRKKSGWAVCILTADPKFPDYFKRSRPDRVRKFYNGRIRVNYYQYDPLRT